MNRMQIDASVFASELGKLPDLPRDIDPNAESDHVARLLQLPSLREKLNEYAEPRPEGVGGSGLVISANFVPFNIRRAIKLPRKRIFETAPTNDDLPRVAPELHALSKVSHQHITRLYDAIPLEEKRGHCIITECVPDPRSLDRFTADLCCNEQCRRNDLQRGDALRQLARVLYPIVDALKYMNETARLIHFDIKPLNILVSSTGYPYVTDLGFARDLTRYGPDDKVEVGFTWKYAHPRLLDPHYGARVSHTPAKARNILLGKEVGPNLDIFSFGRTLQEILFKIKETYGDEIHSDYTYNYLHMIASLCLDGRNSAGDDDDSAKSFVSDCALGMPTALFRDHKYTTFSDVKSSLERLLGLARLENQVPELDTWAGSTINVSDLGITTWTPRLKSLCEHPAVERLAQELQLGMLDMVFPTATHSRLQHSLGTFHAVCGYIAALYHDPDNPTFRILFSEVDCRRSLLAALLHDLGHTNFGHDLEEVDRKEFSHSEIGREIIESTVLRDGQGRTLSKIITGDAPDEWGLSNHDLLKFLEANCVRPVDGVYLDILEGQLDADKLDYLIRDSIECRVPYGRAIDDDRFLRSLTTLATGNGENASLRLAIKNKGAASAEAFAFARYQLYQSLYWHHTFRAIKGMFITAAATTLSELRSGTTRELLREHPFRRAYVNDVLGVRDATTEQITRGKPRKKKGEAEPIPDRIANLLSNLSTPPGGKYGRDRTLVFLWKLSSGKARTLLEDLMTRRYYKRVIEIPLGDLDEHGWTQLSKRFEGDQRLELQNAVEEGLRTELIRAIQDESSRRESLVRDEALARVSSIADGRFAFIVDLLLRGWVAGGNEPLFVSDYKRRYFRTTAGMRSGQKGNTLWSDTGEMMRRIAFFRVFAEPDIHHILTRVLRAPAILKALANKLPELKQLIP
jgi:HD superfamily phosphohydrolase